MAKHIETKDRVITDSVRYLNPPKGYKKSTTNQPDPNKVKEYYAKKKK